MARPIRIGLVFSYSLAYCRGILRGVKAYARTKHDWIFTPVDPESGGVQLLRDLKPAGVIAHIYTEQLAAALRALRRPLVNVCGVLPEQRIPRVGLDDAAIGRAAAEHLLSRGVRHFAFIGHANHAYSVGREKAFSETIRAAGLSVHAYHETRTRFDPRGRLWALDERVEKWVTALPRPAGIFACNDLWGVQLSEACRQRNLRVPEDLAIVGVDNDDLLCELARPSLSSVAVPAESVGHEAARLLDRLMSGQKPPARPVLLPPTQVVTRQSSDILAIDDPDVAAAMRLIRERSHAPIEIEALLEQIPVSRRSLERKFRRSLSRGIWDEIRRVHLDRAKALLSSTDLPMSAVASSSGFTDGKHLSIVFRQEMGQTPTAYRNQFRSAVRSPG